MKKPEAVERGPELRVVGDTEQIVVEIKDAKRGGRHAEVKWLEGELLKLLWPKLKAIARRFPPGVRGSLDAEDLEQVGAIAALKMVDAYDPEKRGSTTFEKHACRRAFTAMRAHVELHGRSVHVSQGVARGRSKRHRPPAAPLALEGPAVLEREEDPAGTPEDSACRAEDVNRVRAAVARLPAKLREVVELSMRDLSAHEIAERLGVSDSTVDQRLGKAKKQLREMLGANSHHSINSQR